LFYKNSFSFILNIEFLGAMAFDIPCSFVLEGNSLRGTTKFRLSQRWF